MRADVASLAQFVPGLAPDAADQAADGIRVRRLATLNAGAFTLPVSFPSRIGDPGGKTSPEELMAAAHAACYAMALNGTLGRKGASADRTLVTATVTADKGDAGIKIESSRLTVVVRSIICCRSVHSSPHPHRWKM